MAAVAEKKVALTKRVFNLSNKSDREEFLAISGNYSSVSQRRRFDKKYFINNYLNGGNSLLMHGDNPVFFFDNNNSYNREWAVIKDNIVYDYNYNSTSPISDRIIGIILDRPFKGFAKTLILRGDNEFNNLVSGNKLGMPTFSFSALSRMVYNDETKKNVGKVVDSMISGAIEVLDFTADEKEPLTKAQKKQLTAHRKSTKNNPPPTGKAGFSIVGNEWHKSASFLLRHNANNMGRNTSHYIFGQDEGTYFGSVLPVPVKTVDEAFEILIPEEAKEKKYQRQGEWFIIPVDESEIPSIQDTIAFGSVVLPLEDEKSNAHTIFTSNDEVINVRVSSDGRIYAKDSYLYHNQHDTIYWKGWVTFYRNTALKSVSAESNVD